MSVALLISKKHDRRDSNLIPVATQDVFHEVWIPPCQALGLKYLPMFETGTALEQEDLDCVIEELGRLKEHFESTSNELTKHIVSRIELLASSLNDVKGRPDLEIWIG
jgi:hypothetical protein